MPDLFNGDPIPLNRPGDFDFPSCTDYASISTKDTVAEVS